MPRAPRPDAVLVDGYNLLHAIPRFAPRGAELAPARTELERWLADAAARRSVPEVILVWDGEGGGAAGCHPPRPLRIVFTKSGETADERILSLLRGPYAGRAGSTWVVSSDHGVQTPARELGFEALGAMTFFRRWSDARARGSCAREAERGAARDEDPAAEKPRPTRRDVDRLLQEFLEAEPAPSGTEPARRERGERG